MAGSAAIPRDDRVHRRRAWGGHILGFTRPSWNLGTDLAGIVVGPTRFGARAADPRACRLPAVSVGIRCAWTRYSGADRSSETTGGHRPLSVRPQPDVRRRAAVL